jgi:N-formylglutamate deformylase
MQLEMPVFKLRQGNAPLVVSMPHVGTYIPAWLAPRLTEAGLSIADTDWHLEQLYHFLDDLDATVIIATHSRYVIDLNRPSDDVSLYPGQNTTGLCPVDAFNEAPLYLPNQAPSADEVQKRITNYWQPYHQTLNAELSRVKAVHGRALLWDAHSIGSVVPRFFEGTLPHLNVGTANHASCDAALAGTVYAVAEQSDYESVLNGRFKGGFITRHYGRPAENIHAVQLEIATRAYMQSDDVTKIDEELSAKLRPILRAMMQAMLDWEK